MSVVSPSQLQIHVVLRTIRHFFTFSSILLAVPTITIIVLCARRISKQYSMLIAIIDLLVVSSDVVRELLLDPIILLPEICILRQDSYRPVIAIPGGANLYTELFVGVFTQSVPFFFECFMERHQAVQTPGSRFRFSVTTRRFMFLFIMLNAIIIPILLKVGEMPAEMESVVLQNLSVRWPSLHVSNADCFGPLTFTIFMPYTNVGMVVSTLVIIVLSWHTFHTIKKVSTISDAKKIFHTSLSRVLYLQAMIPLALLIFPMFCALVAVLALVGGPLPLSICFLFMSFHPLTHSLILLTFTLCIERRSSKC